MNIFFKKLLKKIIKIYFSNTFVILISLIRALKIKDQKIVESKINLGSSWEFLYKLSFIERNILISAESKKLIFYEISNQGIESFDINSISNEIKIKQGDGLVYVVLEHSKLIRYLLLDLYTKRILYYLVFDAIQRKYLTDSIKTIKNKLEELRYLRNPQINNLNSFNYRYEGNIQYFKNFKDTQNKFNFNKSLIISSKRKIKKISNDKKGSEKKRIIVFYLDNISFGTMQIIKKNKHIFPNLSKIFQDEKLISFNNSMSISNWTYPAAISFLTGIPFEKHQKYFPWEKNYLDLINKIYTGPNSYGLNSLKKNFKLRFRAGSNWRMLQHHGLHSFFTNCMSNPKMADIYSVASQVFKQLDIAGDESSFHWIDIMDTHHPVKNSILPSGSINLNLDTIIEGLHYENGSKYKYGEHLKSTREIYFAQIKSVDYFIGAILNYSYEKITENNHLLAFISDHGTHVMNDNSSFSKHFELHNPLISVLPNENNIQFFKSVSNLPFNPANFLSLLDFSLYENKGISHYKEICFEYPYAQIIYPNQPYQLLILSNKKDIYRFESDILIPKDILKNSYEFECLFKRCLGNGEWRLLNKSGDYLISEKDLPQNIKNFFFRLINN